LRNCRTKHYSTLNQKWKVSAETGDDPIKPATNAAKIQSDLIVISLSNFNVKHKLQSPKARLSIRKVMLVDQAAIRTGFDFRRYAMKPKPAKPRIIIAHVEGSGTADMFQEPGVPL
jgi:hypothetical protein